MALAGIEDGLAKFAHDHAAGDIKTGVLPIERGGTGANTAAAALEALGVPAAVSGLIAESGAARIQVGSYVGTGTNGSANPNTLTLSFDPKLVIVKAQASNYHLLIGVRGATQTWINYPTSSNFSAYSAILVWGDKSVSWYTQNGANRQLNESGVNYFFVAIG